MMNAPEKPRLLSLANAAKSLGVKSSWLKQEAEAGRVPCLDVGDRLLFNVPAVENVLVERAKVERLQPHNGDSARRRPAASA